ncbi:MAG: hypothetical protein AAFW97_14630 [Pseudomonadota bacterium]
MTYDFSTITEVKLAVGSHDSPQQGLCVMEMVAWFAGEEHSDRPQCACPVLGRFAMNLNDAMPGGVRDRLLKPLVPLLAGTRDPESEIVRAEYLAMQVVRSTLPPVLRQVGLGEHADACEAVSDLKEAAYAASAAANAANAANAASAAASANAATAWERAVDDLRHAITLGKHEGLTLEPAQRHEDLRKLVAA